MTSGMFDSADAKEEVLKVAVAFACAGAAHERWHQSDCRRKEVKSMVKKSNALRRISPVMAENVAFRGDDETRLVAVG